MPPANSPIDHLTASSTPVRSHSPASYLHEFGRLGSPVPDLASTLTLEAEDEADADNVSFLRTPITLTTNPPAASARPREAPSASRSQPFSTAEQSLSSEARERRHRSLNPVQRRPEGMGSSATLSGQPASGGVPGNVGSSGRSPYGVRAPSQQSLYDWAPATEEGDEEELEGIMADLRAQQPNTHPDILRVLGRAQLDAQNELRTQARARISSGASAQSASSSQLPQSHEPSLRSAAILQSVRRNRQLSARSRDLMQRYVMDRERAGNESEDRDRSNSSMWFRVAANANDSNRWEQNRMAWQASQRPGGDPSSSANREARTGEAHEALRRRYLDDPSNTPSRFESIIRVLDRLRAPDLDAAEARILIKKCQESRRSSADATALAKLSRGLKPPRSSWLTAGMTFSGYQQAAPMPINCSGGSGTTPDRSASDQSGRSTSTTNAEPARAGDTGSQASATSTLPTATSDKDRWAVRVAVHDVDYEKMTLQGTMEAYNVPWIPTPHRISVLRSTATTNPHTSSSQSHPPATNPTLSNTPTPPTTTTSPSTPPKTTFSTYLEGSLLDFSIHTLRTTTHAATPANDAQYWRRLAPFSSLPNDQLAIALLNPDWLERELRDKYILMRWKERCFVRGCLIGREAGGSGDVRVGNSSRLDTVHVETETGRETIHRVPESEPGFPPIDQTGNLQAGYTAGYGLSISGFYYVSLRRSDGHVEGLYFDPASNPFQHLDLRPEGKMGRGAWEFA